MNFDRLRFVAERADVGEAREAVFALTLPEKRGSFLRLCEAVGKRSVTEFNYRISDPEKAHAFVGLQISSEAETEKLANNSRKKASPTIDLTGNEMATTHKRCMVRGDSSMEAARSAVQGTCVTEGVHLRGSGRRQKKKKQK